MSARTIEDAAEPANTQWEEGGDEAALASLGFDADYQAWLDARVAAALAAQDDAELVARRWGPEPEFMLRAAGGDHGC